MNFNYNTLKSEHINHFSCNSKESLDSDVNAFAYVWYNRMYPYTYDNGKTPATARAS